MPAPTPVWSGVVTHGHVEYDRAGDRCRYLMGLEGTRIEESFRKPKDQRSVRANSYLWVVYGYIAEETGDSPEDVHEFMKAKFLGHRTIRLNDKRGAMEEQVVVGSSAALTSGDFYDYVEKVRLFAAEWLGLSIPDPAPGLLVRKRAA